jgi:preprotein translocase subunit SecG
MIMTVLAVFFFLTTALALELLNSCRIQSQELEQRLRSLKRGANNIQREL